MFAQEWLPLGVFLAVELVMVSVFWLLGFDFKRFFADLVGILLAKFVHLFCGQGRLNLSGYLA